MRVEQGAQRAGAPNQTTLLRAFTLLEMMVVVAIMGVMASLAQSSYRETAVNLKLSTAVNGTASLIQRARAVAVTTRSRVEVSTATAGFIQLNSCRARFGAVGCTGASVLSNANKPVQGAYVRIGSGDTAGVTLAGAPGTPLIFGPDGLPETTTTYLYQFSHPDTSVVRKVTVSAAGEVSVD